MEQKRLLIAGSHAGSTAIAVVEEIRRKNLNWEIHWVGKKYASEGSKNESLEYKNLHRLGVIFHNLESGKIQTKFTRYTIPAILKIPLGFLKSKKIIKKLNPDLVLTFGGAVGALVSFWSNMAKIPVIIHEQTATAGKANIFSSYFAKLILVSRESSFPYFSKAKTKLIGSPINIKIINMKDEMRSTRIKTILITGGSRGSTWINDAIKPILPKLLEKYFVIHQTGETDIANFSQIENDKYLSFAQTEPKNMAEILKKADLVISRAGANTVWELIVLKKPAILIPIPWTYNNEQFENAKYMEDLGLAIILPQKDLTAQRLFSDIEKMIHDYSKILKNTEKIVSPDLLASEKLVNICEEYI